MTNKKLFSYSFEVSGVVVADSAEAAEAIFSAHCDEILRDEGDYPIIPIVDEITSEKDLPAMWDRECIPYGNDDSEQNARIKHYLETL